jgi:hypothetical protein
MRRDGQIIGVRVPGTSEWRYPAWQFVNGKPLPGVARVVNAAREAGLDDRRLYDVMTAPLGLGRGEPRRLCDLLPADRVDDVVAAIRASA